MSARSRPTDVDGAPGSARIAALVAREAPRVLDYLLRRVASPEDAADLLGETLVVVWRREGAVPLDPTEARMWMFGVARKVLSQHRRSVRRSRSLGERLALEVREAIVQAPADDFEELRAAIETLREGDREIIRLVYWDGFTLAEAARLLGLNAATVRSRHARARATLQAQLAETLSDVPR
ncbi:sigma-70 family RNA polymerase sigma factor [Agrococcus versicolor]|uniref:RNA polymerase sigma factor n=1 Tax=Agrococcus versicolor TaxID=501482 RepID=UPI0031E1B6DC